MLRSLVGSEMCIRDRSWNESHIERFPACQQTRMRDRVLTARVCARVCASDALLYDLRYVRAAAGRTHDGSGGQPIIGRDNHWTGKTLIGQSLDRTNTRQNNHWPGKPLDRPTIGSDNHWTGQPFGCLRFTKLYGVGKHLNTIMKLTKSPTQGQPNPKKNSLKAAFVPLFSHSI